MTSPVTPRPRGRILAWQGQGKWRWFAVGVVISGALVAATFEFRHAGLAGLANAAAVVSVIPPIVVGLVAWAKRDESGATLSDFLRAIADAQGITSEDLKALLYYWPGDDVDAYLNGEQLPPWNFISAFLDEVSRGDPQRRELLQRKLREVWSESGGLSSRNGHSAPGSEQGKRARRAAPPNNQGRSNEGSHANRLVLFGAAVVMVIAAVLVLTLSPFHRAIEPGTHQANKPGPTASPSLHTVAPHTTAPKNALFLAALPSRVLSGTFSSNGNLLSVGTANGDIREWNVSTHALVDSMTDQGSKGVNALAFSVNNTLLATADANGYVSLWAGHNLVQTLADPTGSSVLSVAFSFDKSFLAIGDAAGNVYTCQLVGQSCGNFGSPMSDPDSKGVDSVAFNPGSSVLAAGDANGNIYMWIHTLGKIIPDPSGKAVRSVTFTADNNFLVAGDSGGNVYQWGYTSSGNEVTATSPITSLADPDSKGVESVAVNPRTEVITTADANGSVYMWHGDVSAQPPLIVPSGYSVLSAAFNGANAFFAIGNASGHVYLWPVS
jgi:hypothetical protein